MADRTPARQCAGTRNLGYATLLAVLASWGVVAAQSPGGTSVFRTDDRQVALSPADRDAAALATRVYRHAQYARTQAGQAARGLAKFDRHRRWSGASPGRFAGWSFQQNPGDVTFQGGQTVEVASSQAVFVNPGQACTIAGCWGDPESFLTDLGRSDFIHLVDQYVGLWADRRYTLGSRAVVTDALPASPVSESDLIAILHAVVLETGQTGYGHVYHLFLPPNVDTCLDAPAGDQCYSPDNQSTFVFCAYHDSVTFADVGHVLFTVEPYQNVTGCADPPGGPNGQLADSANDTLSHELFETITDPDGDAFWNGSNFALYGEEIGDECLFLGPDGVIAEPTFVIGRKLYRVQSEYSNARHACAIAP